MQRTIDNQSYQPYEDEIDLRELFSTLWSSRVLILSITLVFTTFSLIYALVTPDQYKATMLLAPAKQNNSSSISSALSQFGGIASLAGISLGDGQDSDARVAVEVMQSRSFIEQFIKQSGIIVEIMAAKGWDFEKKRLIIDKDIFDIQTNQWMRTPPSRRDVTPSLWEAYEVFSQILQVSQDKKTGLITVSIEYYSPYMARQWVENYILAINLYLQQRKLKRIEKNIRYLEEQIATTSVAEMREIFFTLIEEQVKGKMLVEASPEYAFTAVGEAMLPEKKSQPKRALIVVLGMLLGAILSIFLVLLRYYWFNNNSNSNNS